MRKHTYDATKQNQRTQLSLTNAAMVLVAVLVLLAGWKVATGFAMNPFKVVANAMVQK